MLETETTNIESTGAESTVATEGNPAADSAEGAVEGASKEAYSPNFKYKYAVEGKQAEAEIDDLFKPLIKDADTEKRIRELHEKAYGLDFIKRDRDGLKQWSSQIHDEYTQQTKALQAVGAFVKNKDYDAFFETWGIPEQEVLQYALNKVKYHQLPQEQKALYDQQSFERRRLTELELQNQELHNERINYSVSQRENDLGLIMNRPDVSSAVQAFDQRAGMQGAFRNEVIKRGQYYWHAYQQDVPVDQVVSEVLNLVGMQQQQQQQMQQAAPQPKPKLPNITGKGSSPVKAVPRNLDDLRKLASRMGAEA